MEQDGKPKEDKDIDKYKDMTLEGMVHGRYPIIDDLKDATLAHCKMLFRVPKIPLISQH